MRILQVIRGLLLAALALGVLVGASTTAAKPIGVERAINVKAARGEYVPGQVILGFRRQASRADFARAHARVPARVMQRFGNLRMEVVKLGRGVSVQQAIRRYERDPAVAFAEPNYIRHVNADLTSDLWGLDNTGQPHPVANGGGTTVGASGADINAPQAWLTTKGSAQTVIAVIDTGVDVSHADLSGQLWENPGETTDCPDSPGGVCAPGVDDDGNGKIDDINGWDFGGVNGIGPGDSTLLSPVHWEGWDHGTHVAGTIAGDDDNDGVVGVCPGCKIMVLKFARDSDGQLVASAEIAALAYAKAHGVKIANMSFGGAGWTNSEREAIRTSRLLAVVSAGNDALDNDMYLDADEDGNGTLDGFSPSYPAAFTLGNVLAVGAMNDHNENGYSTDCYLNFLHSKAQCAFTNWGHDSVDLAAPGVDIESSVPGGYETHDGTSMAAPHVAGTAGLVLSQHPTYTVAQLKNAIMRSVAKPTNLRTLYIPSYVAGRALKKPGAFSRTTGRANASKALSAGTSNATPLTDGNINGAKSFSGSSVTGAVSWPADVNDVKKRKFRKGHYYRITLGVPKGKDYDLFVWKPGTKEIWQIPGGTNFGRLAGASAKPRNGADEVVTFKAGSTGVYYIHVSAWLFKSGSYKLTVKKLL
jgi:subtilisin family serine protease